jgi:hypothetical protein
VHTTLNKIRQNSPCHEGWTKLLRHLGKTAADDEPLSLLTILDSNGIDDALWCLRSLPEQSRRWRKLAVAFARTVQHLMTDPRSLAALDVADRHAEGLATDDELDAARDAAGAAARAAAWDAAWAATRAAAWDAAWAATRAAAWDAAWDAAWAATRAATWDAARERLEVIFRASLEEVAA